MDYVDVLRGLACLWVLLHHTFEFYPVAHGIAHLPFRLLVIFSTIGWLGVSLFLVLSGFCLYYPMACRAMVPSITLDTRTFAVRRARRILPPYYVALVLSLGLALFDLHRRHRPLGEALAGWKDLPMHLLMVHNLSSMTFASINGVFWSLALECQLYLIFPVLVWLAARRGLPAILAITFGVAVSWQTAVFHHFGFTTLWTPTLGTWYHALPGRSFEFAAGMTAAALVARPHPRQERVALGLVSVLIVPGLFYVAHVSRFGPLLDQIWGTLFACALVLWARVPAEAFAQRRLLKALTWVGTISYSIYLIHPLVFDWVPLRRGSDAMLVAEAAGRILLAVGVAFLFHLAFEKPFMSGGKKSNRPRLPAALEAQVGTVSAL